jgi:hypothetical protein
MNRTDNLAPTTCPASNCSQGGQWVTTWLQTCNVMCETPAAMSPWAQAFRPHTRCLLPIKMGCKVFAWGKEHHSKMLGGLCSREPARYAPSHTHIPHGPTDYPPPLKTGTMPHHCPTATRNDPQYLPQPCEPLLAGWNTGAGCHITTRG